MSHIHRNIINMLNTNKRYYVIIMTNNYQILHDEHMKMSKAMLEDLDNSLDKWKSSGDRGFLTGAEIDFLRLLAKKYHGPTVESGAKDNENDY